LWDQADYNFGPDDNIPDLSYRLLIKIDDWFYYCKVDDSTIIERD